MVILDRGGRPIFTGNRNGGFEFANRNLPEAAMRGLDLRHANFKRANIRASDLANSDVSGACFVSTKASNCDFRNANCNSSLFWDTELVSCGFQNADLRNAHFGRANLTNSDITGAMIEGADFIHADLTGVVGLEEFNILPDGDLIGWKKLGDDLICKLSVPATAHRVNPLGSRFCRTDFAIVLEIEGGSKTGFAKRDRAFTYEVGKAVTPVEVFNSDIRIKCTSGIYFFLNRDEAVNS